MKIMIILSIAFLSFSSFAEETIPPEIIPPNGQVTLPLNQYQTLVQQASTQGQPAPSSYAVGQSLLNIVFKQHDGHMTATVRAELTVETFEDEWTLVALLGPGAALESATINGTAVQLIQRVDGLFWLSEKRQQANIQLTYHVDAHFSDLAYVTSLPIPGAAATRFTLQIPQRHIDLSVAPATNLVKNEENNGTVASGTVASSRSMMVAWRVAQEREYVMSQADYNGSISGEAIAWNATIGAEMLVDGEVTVPLISSRATLVAVDVDGKAATVFNQDGRFAVRLAGAGLHTIRLSFLSAVSYPDGVPSTGFDIPGVPISKFELTLPGEKLVQVVPLANVETETIKTDTKVTFYIPMSETVALTWMEAIPEYVAIENRSTAVVYHALHAAEGVLYGQAAIHYEITRGEANSLQFSIPVSAQVNSITSASGAIVDWTLLESDEKDTLNRIQVFLNRAIKGEFVLDVNFEQLLEEGQLDINVPMLRALDVIRQKGMLVLLSGSDLALAPEKHTDMSEVGENQLPAFFRNQLEQTVSHTYKYHADSAQLLVNTVTPERQQGKFNAQIDSLISIGEVTLRGQVSAGIDVKSGVLRDLQLVLPSGINILGVSGPSIRTHQVSAMDDHQQVNIEFTQEMDGQFRIELNYERIMLDGTAETSVPRIEVAEADVEHGRIAIEALSALEVQAKLVEQLSTLEINELPRQLVLKTTNPILLAYRYVKTEKPFTLDLSIIRHEEIDVQVAAIDSATYQTLFTTDGLAVTRVQFDVRNSRRQFLRLALPAGSEIWSVFVNGQPQKPAFAAGQDGGSRDVLVKMVNSATAFPVELVYATRNKGMDTFGRIEGSLPRPDMIVTRSRWDVYVPSTPRYGAPKTNMEVLTNADSQPVKLAAVGLLRDVVANVITGEPLHIELPTQGMLYSFAKLYANQAEEDAYFTLRYVHQRASFVGLWISLLASAAMWAGIILIGLKNVAVPRYLPFTLFAGGSLLLTLSVTLLGVSTTPVSVLSLVVAIAVVGWIGWQRWQLWRI
jgi:hypothetical protein